VVKNENMKKVRIIQFVILIALSEGFP
jgi:hypothetical protein